ncbi:calphotin [Pygocentrus nattereri]|uniref:G protein-regulated inducer of neurite outgrowth C-terminal domain-containing protein n=1 Tax=Pygocentrus nattereri TaxID=42514 RepID=A0A3B4DRY6_PYGNA|nr:calphotin [Pygocentrus nattereri]XP_017573905.1 calphotin [Pygocentrus nattereri]
MEGPILTQSEVWKFDSGICADFKDTHESDACVTLVKNIMVDNKPTEACKQTETGTQEDVPTISQTETTKVDQLHSAVPHSHASMEDLGTRPGLVQDSAYQYELISGDGPTRRERFTSDRQQASQEITILVTNHEAPEMEIEETEKIEIPTFLEPNTSGECTTPTEDDSLDASKVVADLIELSQLQETKMISNSSAVQSVSTVERDLPQTERYREVHIVQTQQTKVSDDSANAEFVVSSDLKDLKIKAALKQTKPLEHRDAEDLCRVRQDLTFGQQQHVQTQVSLEAMYQSVATSPMTPPQGSAAFFFPYSLSKLGSSGGSEAIASVTMKDAELQVGAQVEYRSVATAPMTPVVTNAPDLQVETHSVATAPMTPVVTNAPGLQVETRSVATAPMTPVVTNAPDLQVETRSVATAPMTPIATTAPELQVETRSVATAPMTPIATAAPELQVETRSVATAPMTPIATAAPALHVDTRSVATAPMTPIATAAPELQVETRSIATAPMTPIATAAPELQVGTRSIATAPMTPIATTAPELQIETRSVATAPMTPIVTAAPELQVETRSIATAPMTPIATTAPALHVETHSVATAPMTPLATAAPVLHVETHSVATAPMTPIVKSAPELHTDTRSIATAPMTPIATNALQLHEETHSVATAPMTPIVTQSPQLLVETRSVATAPMTPTATRPPQLHVETRSIATAPMTPIATRPPQLHVETRSIATAPMTPIATRPPQLHVETRSIATGPMTPIARKAPELQAHSIATSPMNPIVLSSPELIPLPEPRAAPGPEEPPEPVQDVSWDEKGMTWEVYGAVVEVAVLGTAIQKHLEKQVKKQQKDSVGTPALAPSSSIADTASPLPSSPPATSASSRCSSAKGSRKKEEGRGTRGRRRQNPLRLFFRNVRRPSCCSRAHSEERH